MDRTPKGTPAPLSQSEITALVLDAQQGRRDALNRLVERFQPDIFRMIFYRTQSADDAEDLTQDVFMSMFRGIRRLKQPDRFKGWLYRIALNRLRDHYRKKRLRALFGQMESEPPQDPDWNAASGQPEALRGLMRRDFWQSVETALSRLSKMERTVFRLRFFDQLNLQEISQALKKNESTVKTHLYRGVKKMKHDDSLRNLLERAGR